MLILINRLLRRFVTAWPGEKYFKEYRFLPIFFVSGAALEFLMIHWHPGGVNFYQTYKRNKVQEIIEKNKRADLFKTGDLKVEF